MIREAFAEAQNYLAQAGRTPRAEGKPFERDLEAGGAGPGAATARSRGASTATAPTTSPPALRLADEFGYRLVINHGTEAHLLADVLAERDIPVIIGPLFTTRSKVELRNRSLANPGRLAAAGVKIAITTDHPVVPINFLDPPGHAGGQGGPRPRRPRCAR